jgi:hypothetical protein
VNGIDPGIARLLESEGGKDEFEGAGDYKEGVVSGLSYSSDWVGRVSEVGEMKTVIRKSYRSKTLRLVTNTMTDTPPGAYLFLYVGDSRGCRGSGGGCRTGWSTRG